MPRFPCCLLSMALASALNQEREKMSNSIKTELNIPDIWYDFYARLLPGSFLVFSARYFIQNKWIVPTATETFLLISAGYFLGLFFQPLASSIAKLAFERTNGKTGAESIADVQAKVGAESRRSKVLSKMQAETVFFAQLIISDCLLLVLYFYSGLDKIHVLFALILVLPYLIFGLNNVAKRRFQKASRYGSSHDKNSNLES